MKLLIHGINYAPERLSTGRYTGELGAWLAARGHNVTVLCAPPYYPAWRVSPGYQGLGWWREWLDGVEVLRAPLYVPNQVTGKKRLLHEFSFAASSLKWWPKLWQQNWDVVVAVCPLLQSGLIPGLLAKIRGVPFLFHIQDLQVDMARQLGLLSNSGLLSFAEKIENWMLQSASLVTTISEGMAERLRQKGISNSRLRLFPNWADLDNVQPGARQNSLRQKLDLNPDEIVILYAGNLGEKQGLEIILECAQLTKHNSKIVYVIAGEGAARARLLTAAKEYSQCRIKFLPTQPDDLFPLLLALGDIHLVIQKQKASDLAMPSKLTNIMAAGRPFITTAMPGTELSRVAAVSHAGILIPPENAVELAQSIINLASDETSRQEMGRRARAYAETWLDRETILTHFEALLYQLAGSIRQSVPYTSDTFLPAPPPG